MYDSVYGCICYIYITCIIVYIHFYTLCYIDFKNKKEKNEGVL